MVRQEQTELHRLRHSLDDPAWIGPRSFDSRTDRARRPGPGRQRPFRGRSRTRSRSGLSGRHRLQEGVVRSGIANARVWRKQRTTLGHCRGVDRLGDGTRSYSAEPMFMPFGTSSTKGASSAPIPRPRNGPRSRRHRPTPERCRSFGDVRWRTEPVERTDALAGVHTPGPLFQRTRFGRAIGKQDGATEEHLPARSASFRGSVLPDRPRACTIARTGRASSFLPGSGKVQAIAPLRTPRSVS